jgi:hypothetical protein
MPTFYEEGSAEGGASRIAERKLGRRPESLVTAADDPALGVENDRVRVASFSGHTVPVPILRWPCILLIATWSALVCRDHPGQVILDTRLGAEALKLNTPAWQDFRRPISWKGSKTKSLILAAENQSVPVSQSSVHLSQS